MIKYNMTIDGHIIPAGSKCYCVTRHVPSYAHVLPYVLPDLRVLHLCPNTFHSTKALLKIYRALRAAPDTEVLKTFTTAAQRLARLHYRMETEGLESEQILAAERLTKLVEKREI